MAVPRNRQSNARKNIRRAHDAKKPKNSTKCSNCGIQKVAHRVCASCGSYKKRMVVQKEQVE